jgi:hypothetical protein
MWDREKADMIVGATGIGILNQGASGGESDGNVPVRRPSP